MTDKNKPETPASDTPMAPDPITPDPITPETLSGLIEDLPDRALRGSLQALSKRIATV